MIKFDSNNFFGHVTEKVALLNGYIIKIKLKLRPYETQNQAFS